jgi:hypothetical protein
VLFLEKHQVEEWLQSQPWADGTQVSYLACVCSHVCTHLRHHHSRPLKGLPGKLWKLCTLYVRGAAYPIRAWRCVLYTCVERRTLYVRGAEASSWLTWKESSQAADLTTVRGKLEAYVISCYVVTFSLHAATRTLLS